MISLLLACSAEFTGRVHTPAGDPVSGATLDASECAAVTGADGSFRTRCERTQHSFVVSHPDHQSAALDVEPGKPPPSVVLPAWPVDAGLYLVRPGNVSPLPTAVLVHTASPTEERWCLGDAVPTEVSAGKVVLFDVHDVEFRIYRLDDEGCAFRMKPGQASYWSWSADRVTEASRETITTGRDKVTLDLSAGDYAIAEWFDGFLVPEKDGAAAWLLRAR